jgi:hypothetical protein
MVRFVHTSTIFIPHDSAHANSAQTHERARKMQAAALSYLIIGGFDFVAARHSKGVVITLPGFGADAARNEVQRAGLTPEEFRVTGDELVLANIPDGTVLAYGAAGSNFDYVLRINQGGARVSIPSREVRSVPKADSGCVETCFGSLNYWKGFAQTKPASLALTEAGRAFMEAPLAKLQELGGAW